MIFGLIPPAIILLYFLKLRRNPLEVPSTFLWRRTIEDMHVNSLWQRLRQNLLLFLQLLILGLLMLACLRPSWQAQSRLKNRLIFLVDTSASMSANDEQPSRLAVAKQKVDDLIEQMAPGDVAMLVSFSDRAKVEQPFTTNKGLLKSHLAAIQPTQRPSDITEALQVAAGLANPGRSGDANAGDVAAAEAMPADVFILSDGGFRTIPEFSWGNLNPIYLPIGSAEARNLAIAAFNVQPNPARPDRMEAFIEVQSFSPDQHDVELGLKLDDVLLDAAQLTIPPGETAATSFRFDRIESGTLSVSLDPQDDLAADNRAFAAINPARRANVMLVTSENDALEMGLGTDTARKVADISIMEPAGMASGEFQRNADEGAYDLVIFDRCRPEVMPKANTLFFGAVPPGDVWSEEATVNGPQIIDVELSHPLMKYLVFGDVRIAAATPIEGPPGAQILVDSDAGALCAIAPREGFEDVVVGFEIFRKDDAGNTIPNTDWPIRSSFPLFCKNVLEYLAGANTTEPLTSTLPGQPVFVRVDASGRSITVQSPDGTRTEAVRDRNNAYLFAETNQTGVYEVLPDGQTASQRFAVNLFDATESRIVPQAAFETAWNKVAARAGFETTRRDAWRWILLFAVVVLLAEWYIYNRRVYL